MSLRAHRPETAIDDIAVFVFTVPTEQSEADGTFSWDATTIVVVIASSAGQTGLGFTYASAASATVVTDLLRPATVGLDALDVTGAWQRMVAAIRNIGRPGVVSTAIAAVDVALWDLKARLLAVPLTSLLGAVREAAPIYGSGGFTNYTDRQLTEQLAGWVHDGEIPRVKMKIGTDWGRKPKRDVARVALARAAIGDDAELFVDANGAYTRKEAVRVAAAIADSNVTWFEEPVSSDDLVGLRVVRDAIAADVAAGEYGWDLAYFQSMLAGDAVDVLQADVSRCAGITEWLRVAAVAAAHGIEISGHCAPSLHVHAACAVPNLRHLEYFHDHARVDRLLFDGVIDPADGRLRPDRSRPGIGLELKHVDAARYRTG